MFSALKERNIDVPRTQRSDKNSTPGKSEKKQFNIASLQYYIIRVTNNCPYRNGSTTRISFCCCEANNTQLGFYLFGLSYDDKILMPVELDIIIIKLFRTGRQS